MLGRPTLLTLRVGLGAPLATPRALFVSAFDTVRVSNSMGILGSSRHLSSCRPIPTANISRQSRSLHITCVDAMNLTGAGPIPISRFRRGYVSHSGRTCRRFSTVKGDSDSRVEQPSSPVRSAQGDNTERPTSSYGKLKMVMKQYGPVAIVTYLGVYVTTLGGIFAGITYGIDPAAYGMDPEYLVKKVTGMLEAYSWADPLRELIEQNPAVADFALAWILTKFTEPVRAVFTLAIVPRIARALGKGLPKPPQNV